MLKSGMKWGEIAESKREELLNSSHVINAISACDMKKSGECVVDLTDEFSIAGYVEISEEGNEIIINDSAVIYSPAA